MDRNESSRSLYQEAEEEAMVLSLNPNKKKKNKPRELKPLPMPAGKMSGNYAAEVLKQMEEKDNNKDRSTAIRDLNKEINGYLKFDTEDLMMGMNNAFEGS